MAIPFAHHIDMQGLQLLNFVVHSTGTSPVSPSGGMMWWENDTWRLNVYDDDDLAWKRLVMGPSGTTTVGELITWAVIDGSELSATSYGIATDLNASAPATSVARADAAKSYSDSYIADEAVGFATPGAGEDTYLIQWQNSTSEWMLGPIGVGVHDILSTSHDATIHTAVQGDIIYSDTNGNWNALAKGADNYYLVMTTTIPNWEELSIIYDLSPSLGGPLNALGNSISNVNTLNFHDGAGEVQTNSAASSTVRFQAYDTDLSGYITFATLTAGTIPTFDLSTSTTIGSNNIVYEGGAFHDTFSDYVANEHIDLSGTTITLTETTNETTVTNSGVPYDLTAPRSWIIGLPDNVTIAGALTIGSLYTTNFNITNINAYDGTGAIEITNVTGLINILNDLSVAGGITLETGATVNTIETTLTEDDTHLPTSGAVYDAIATKSDVSVANQANDRIVTATAVGDALNAEANLTFDGSILDTTGTLQVDTINEHTGTAGVTIDGVLLKDGNIFISDAGTIYIGDSNDFRFYHSGGNSYIYNNTGNLLIYNTAAAGHILFYTDATAQGRFDSTSGDLHVYKGLHVDTIDEYTGSAGVTIEGIKLEDSTFVTAAANMTFTDGAGGPYTLAQLAAGGTPDAHATSHEVGGGDLVDHNNLTNYIASRHVNHISVDIIAGLGLSGGGDISATMTIDLDLSDLTAITTLADADQFGVYDSGVGQRKITYANLITELNSDLTVGSHTHGNITNAGAIGVVTNLPIITTTSGVLTVGTFGSSANTFCEGDDSRLSDARTPTSHASAHISTGGDTISLFNTASTVSGLVPGSNGAGATYYLDGDGAWSVPADSVTPAALTKTNDINVTLTLGGTPSTALLQATSLTLGWTDTLANDRITSAATWDAKVDVSGTPVNDQVAVWTDASTLEGTSGLLYASSLLTVTGRVLANSSSQTALTLEGNTANTDQANAVATFEMISSGASTEGFGPSLYFYYSDTSVTDYLMGYLNMVRDDAGDTDSPRFEIWTSLSTSNPVLGFMQDSRGVIFLPELQTSAVSVSVRWDSGSTPVGELTYPSSDARLKSDISVWNIDALSVLKQFEPKQFMWKDGFSKIKIGWIAQEGLEYIPDMFPLISKTNRYSLAEFEILPYFHKSINQLAVIYETHENKIIRLEKKVVELEEKLSL